MTYRVVLERKQAEGYKATVLGWPECTASAASREQTLEMLRENLRERLSDTEIVDLELDDPRPDRPWRKFAGMFKDNPLLDEVVEEIEAYRRELDAEQEQPEE
ncbi:MAG: type II toxin-antitoxin system HicB family antitoxin [bacterium]|nr:type II toxin-antitoxin system HicB family antitoxin [bacterium]